MNGNDENAGIRGHCWMLDCLKWQDVIVNVVDCRSAEFPEDRDNLNEDRGEGDLVICG